VAVALTVRLAARAAQRLITVSAARRRRHCWARLPPNWSRSRSGSQLRTGAGVAALRQRGAAERYVLYFRPQELERLVRAYLRRPTPRRS
jgi:hypothetical protein